MQSESVHAVQASESPLLITEVYFDTPGVDGDEEWIEIANLSDATVDASGFRIGDEESQGGGEGMSRFPDGALIEPGGVIIVAQTAAGFRRLFGLNPQYEMRDSDASVPDLSPDVEWASGEIALANDGDEVLLFDRVGQPVDVVAYGDSAEAPPGTFSGTGVVSGTTGQSIERLPAGCDSDSAADWRVRSVPFPGQVTLEGDCTLPELAETKDVIPIGEIQGSGAVSPWLEMEVSFRGVVIGKLEDQNASGVRFHSFFVQNLPGDADGNAKTSDGIAVFVGARPPAVDVGDVVIVSGRVTEFFGLTEIDNNGLEVAVESRGNNLPAAIPVNPPPDNTAAQDYFEPLESMRVSLPVANVVGPTFGGCGFAVVNGAETEPRVIRREFSDPVGKVVNVLHTSDVACDGFPNVIVGDRVRGLTGPLTYHFDLFKIVLQDPSGLQIEPLGRAVTAVPRPHGAQFSVASLNLENYFDGMKDTQNDAEPLLTPAQLATKQTKVGYAVAQTLGCPTMLAVQEVEKRVLLLDVAARLVPHCGFEYAISHRESPDARGLDLALMSDPRRVEVQTVQLRQGCSSLETGVVDHTFECPPGEQALFSRPPLEVGVLVEGRPLMIFINHFKSKREGEFETAPLRRAQAAFMASLVKDIMAGDPEAALIVLGDFNDYDHSEVMRILTRENQLHDALADVSPQEKYSYNFAGAAQLIDWILVSTPLLQDVVSASIAHVNADFPFSLASDVDSGLPFRASDHDFPLVILEWIADDPEPVPTDIEPANRAPMPTPSEQATVALPTTVEEDRPDGLGAVPIVVGGAIIVAIVVALRWRIGRYS